MNNYTNILDFNKYKHSDISDFDELLSSGSLDTLESNTLDIYPKGNIEDITSPQTFKMDTENVISSSNNSPVILDFKPIDKPFNVTHSSQFYRGRSFRYAGKWKEHVHYISDDYVSDFVSINNVLLCCIKSNFSSEENKPSNFIIDEHDHIVGIDSEYWSFVMSSEWASVDKEKIIEILGYTPADEVDLANKVDKIDGYSLSENNFSNAYKAKLDGLNIEYGTTEYWDNKIGYIPENGAIIIYTDGETRIVDNKTVNIPKIKIGSGNGYVQDLAFTDDDIRQDLLNHINDSVRHITAEERVKWNNKLNVTDVEEVIENTLIFNRL